MDLSQEKRTSWTIFLQENALEHGYARALHLAVLTQGSALPGLGSLGLF